MRRSRSRSTSRRLAALLVFGSLGPAAPALAQACCAGGAALTPARLELHEDAAVGIESHALFATGSFSPPGGYVPNPAGSSEIDLEEDLVGSVRFFDRGQVSLLVPYLATDRVVRGQGAFGSGIGDVNLGARWDFLEAGESLHIPGIAVLAGVSTPTGRPPEAATPPLLADATGIGAWQLTGGVALEQTFGHHLVLDLSGLVSQRLPRHVDGIVSDLGLQLFAIAGAAWAFDAGQAIALSVVYTGEQNAVVNGQPVPQSGRGETTAALSGMLPLGDDWRLGVAVLDELQISGLGSNLPAGYGFTLTVLWIWA